MAGTVSMDRTSTLVGMRFEACSGFVPSAGDTLVCSCGWLEDDHPIEVSHASKTIVLPRRPRVEVPARRAS